MSYLPLEWSSVALKIAIFEILYNVQKWESRFSLGLNAAKNSHYMRKRFK